MKPIVDRNIGKIDRKTGAADLIKIVVNAWRVDPDNRYVKVSDIRKWANSNNDIASKIPKCPPRYNLHTQRPATTTTTTHKDIIPLAFEGRQSPATKTTTTHKYMIAIERRQ